MGSGKESNSTRIVLQVTVCVTGLLFFSTTNQSNNPRTVVVLAVISVVRLGISVGIVVRFRLAVVVTVFVINFGMEGVVSKRMRFFLFRGDSKESFRIGPLQNQLNQWPSQGSTGKKLSSLIALALNLDDHFFHSIGALVKPYAFLRLLHYPGDVKLLHYPISWKCRICLQKFESILTVFLEKIEDVLCIILFSFDRMRLLLVFSKHIIWPMCMCRKSFISGFPTNKREGLRVTVDDILAYFQQYSQVMAVQTLPDKYQVMAVASETSDKIYSGGIDNVIKVCDLRRNEVSMTLEGARKVTACSYDRMVSAGDSSSCDASSDNMRELLHEKHHGQYS
ncbi:2-oxoglutarate-Fe(II) type oxidoreductase [Artemisia annua]|uniref:2-oxoglutarate-Fe(II) type oxidoreductase n=1 Tax=Artemisia annua TaxID=35608 RepID=A0A2U1L3Z0_ARTAN|nr:2-oxoglutarate-Fe(II) type oxidoreductase [Artemisia annua]